MSYRINGPAGLHGLRKQVSKAKEGPLELRRKKGKENMPEGRRGGKAQQVPEGEGVGKGVGC